MKCGHGALWAISSFVYLLSVSSFAQETTGSIEGWVVDAQGEPVANANVVVTSVEFQGTRGGTTDERGSFRVLVLPPGHYSIRITHLTFESTVIEGVVVSLGRTTSIGRLQLRDRSVELSEVVITGGRQSIDTRSTTTGVVLADTRFQVLPIDRSYLTMSLLAPQSSPSFYGDGINIAGATGVENRYFVDGAEVTDIFRGMGGIQLPYNFIREVQVRSGAYQAEYQSSLGGLVNVVTYHGSNDTHGQIFGFFTNNRFSGSPRLALGKPPEGEFAEYDVGFTLGGPVVRDRLWYFLAYNPRFAKEVVPVTGQPDQTDDGTTHVFASKLTWSVNESNMLTFSMSGDLTKRHGVGVTFMGPLPSYVVSDLNAYLSNIHVGGISMAITGTHIVAGNVVLESSATAARRKEEYSPVGDSGPYWYVDLTSNSVGGTLYRTYEATTQFRGGLRGTVTMGAHTLKSGVEYVEQAYESQDVWQPLWKYSDSLFVFAYRDFAGNVWSRNPSLYVQDSWQLSERMCVNAGIRWDPQFLIASDGTVAQEIIGGVAPRLGIVYQVGNFGTQKITASFGRFFQPVGLSLPAAYHIKRVNTYDVLYPQDPRIDTSGAVLYPGVFSFVGNVPGLKGQYYDEGAIGYEVEMSTDLRANIRACYRNLGQAIEDGWSTEDSRVVYGNPGSGPLADWPRAQRQFASLELTLERASPTGLSFLVSYVLSRNYGNYEGLAQATYSSFMGGLEVWPNTSYAFQSPYMLDNALGLLPQDRTHSLKFYGSIPTPIGLTIGASGYWVSGTPLSEFGRGAPPFMFPIFLRQRGSMGRTPAIWDINLRFVYDMANVIPMDWHPRLILDFLHLFSQKEAVQVDQQHYWIADANGNQLDANPNYGLPIQFQPPMSVRLGIEVNF